MSVNRPEIFDKTVRETNHWVKLMMEELETDNRRQAFNALRSGLHALRDRIRPVTAVHFGAQLPMLLRGAYYEGWRLTDTPTHERDAIGFLNHVDANLARGSVFDASEVARATFNVISECVDAGEVEKVKCILPSEIRALWPDNAPANAE